MATSPHPSDVTRTTLAVLFILFLLITSLWVFRPFLIPLAWASMIVIATWPLFVRLQGRLGGRRWAAVSVMTLALLLLLIIPLALAVVAVIEHAEEIVAWVKSLTFLSLPTPPDWLRALPVAGQRLAAGWEQFAADPEEISRRLAPYATRSVRWFLEQAGGVAIIFVRFLLTVLIAAVLYAQGEKAAGGVLGFADRLAGTSGRNAAILAGNAIRGVALGVVGTAFFQTALAGLGLAVAQVPATAILTGIAFVLCLAQIGPTPVLVLAVIWLFWTGQTTAAILLLIWAAVVGTLDNFIRPFLIRMGADLHLVLIFPGVIGGLVAFGIIGLFIGPVVLAITYTLLSEWVRGRIAEEAGIQS